MEYSPLETLLFVAFQDESTANLPDVCQSGSSLQENLSGEHSIAAEASGGQPASSSSIDVEDKDLSSGSSDLQSEVDSEKNAIQRDGSPDANAKTQDYWERRRKNNEAARRSREARRKKEQETEFAVQLLMTENSNLKNEKAHLLAEVNQMRRALCMPEYRI